MCRPVRSEHFVRPAGGNQIVGTNGVLCDKGVILRLSYIKSPVVASFDAPVNLNIPFPKGAQSFDMFFDGMSFR